jgi:GT2 family glycosyltransferase
MKLSVVIVNYNVKYFLEQALHSVRKACQGLDAEVFVVDNNSVDGSCDMVRLKFPDVILIDNKDNTGFSKANNQAICQAKGDYVLLLNPDTVVEEDCFKKVCDFMDSTPDAGGLGVKMIDGAGKFLPESKRGLPTPDVAFYKIFGLATLFPKSRKFGKYHLGFLDRNEVHSVEVLAGAFMLLRKSLLDKIGLLDEDYFMYGEDIDLSYRITKAGYKNYYFPHTTIIHYKGESTKRTSVNYVFTFYRAMIIFAKKHYSQKHARTFSLLINFAIYVRAFAAVLLGFVKKTLLPSMDFVFILSAFILLKNYWGEYRFESQTAYPKEAVWLNGIVYTLLWMFGLFVAGAYHKRKTFLSVLKGVSAGTIAIAVFYAFVDDAYRFSRALIVLGASVAVLVSYLDRLLIYFLSNKKLSLSLGGELKTIIVGNIDEVSRVQDLLVKSKSQSEYIGFVGIDDSSADDHHFLGNIEQLSDLIEIYRIEEIIFCSKDLSITHIIEWMGKIGRHDIMFKIVPEESLFIIGSNSKNAPGDFYTIEINLLLNKPFEQQKKRVFDIAFSILALGLSPILVLFQKKPFHFFSNWFQVLLGRKTWVGYAKSKNVKLLPRIKEGVLSPLDKNNRILNEISIQKLNFLYAKDYSIEKDFIILLKSLRSLGN